MATQKQRRDSLPEIKRSLPEIKTSVTVRQLEEIALKSHAGRQPIADFFGDEEEYHLIGYEKRLRINVNEIIAGLRKQFPGEVLLAADVNCNNGLAAADLNKREGMEAFGTGGGFWWHEKSGLLRKRYIVVDANELPSGIPENSFHFLISCHTFESAEKIPKLFPGLYKILRPGGLAVFDLEFWHHQADELKALGMDEAITMVGCHSGHTAKLKDYLKWLDGIEKLKADNYEALKKMSEAELKAVEPAIHDSIMQAARFEIRKPR